MHGARMRETNARPSPADEKVRMALLVRPEKGTTAETKDKIKSP